MHEASNIGVLLTSHSQRDVEADLAARKPSKSA